MKKTAREQARAMKTLAQRYTSAETRAMTRQEYNDLIDKIILEYRGADR